MRSPSHDYAHLKMPLCCTKPTRELGQRLQAAVLPPICMECLTRMTSRKEREKAKMVRKERGKLKMQIEVRLRAMVKSQRRKKMSVSDLVAQAISLQIVMPRKTRIASPAPKKDGKGSGGEKGSSTGPQNKGKGKGSKGRKINEMLEQPEGESWPTNGPAESQGSNGDGSRASAVKEAAAPFESNVAYSVLV